MPNIPSLAGVILEKGQGAVNVSGMYDYQNSAAILQRN